METKNETTKPKPEPKPVYEQIVIAKDWTLYIRIVFNDDAAP